MVKGMRVTQRVIFAYYWILCVGSIGSAWCYAAQVSYYSSGLLNRYNDSGETAERMDETSSVQEFLKSYFDAYGPDFQWQLEQRYGDESFVHLRYFLTYRGTRVVEHQLKLHYNRLGWVQYASSSWQHVFELSGKAKKDSNDPVIRRLGLLSASLPSYETRDIWSESEPVVWVNQGVAQYAYDFRASSFARATYVHRYLSETGSVLKDLPTRRGSSTNKVYLASPLLSSTLTSVTLPNVTSNGSINVLKGSFVEVRRQECDGTCTSSSSSVDTALVSINADTVFSDESGFSTDPTQYNYTCDSNGQSDQCPNQGFDGVMIYYHLEEYRTWMDSYLSSMGITSSSVLTRDRVQVVVNNISYDSDGDGKVGGDDTDNAFYIEQACTSDSASNGVCILFYRPSSYTGVTSTCGQNAVDFYDLAREAVVVTHEYQHYVTDSFTDLIPGTGTYNVGDMIHEGYSDYFGASYTSQKYGVADVTNVGAYAFQQCTTFTRQIATLLPFVNSTSSNGNNFADPHISGITWASGLWSLRSSLGVSYVDKMALLSLTFIPQNAGFIDAVESLVRADSALGGANSAAIRTLFYDTLTFFGGQANPYGSNGTVDVGFGGCARVGWSPASGPLSCLVWFLWFVGLRFGARWWNGSAKE